MDSVRQRRGNPADLPPRRAIVEELTTSEDEAERKANETLTQTKTKTKTTGKKRKTAEDDEDDYSPWVDILRVLSFLFFASCGVSYLVSGGETFFWGMKNPPKYLQKQYWAAQWVCPPQLLSFI